MSRDSPRRRRDSSHRPSSRSRRNSDEFVENFSRLLVARDQEFNALQDQKVAELQDEHTKKLEDSILFHEAQRAHAVAELDCYRQQLLLAQQHEIKRAQQLQLKQAEQTRKFEEERQQREREEADRILDAEKRKLEHEQKLREKREEREALQRQKAQTEAENHEPVVNGVTPAPPTQQTATNGTALAKTVPAAAKSSTAISEPQHRQAAPSQKSITQAGVDIPVRGKDALHQRYLEMHKRLKKLRSDVKKAVPSLKDWTAKRLILKKTFGQLVSDSDPEATDMERQKVRAANLLRRKEIIAILTQAKTAPGPTVDARDYIINPQSDLTNLDPASCQVPAVYIYLYNFCAKAGINTIKNTEPPVVEIVGITLAFVFGINDLRFQNESFIDILLAKYHFVSPMLFGIYGPENTERGRVRLGWPHQTQGSKKLWIDEKTFFEEQQYLAVGWAALTLRDFAKARTSRNSCPPYYFWASIAGIVNTAPEAVTRVHFIVLKSLLQNHADKFVKFYGRAATVALRTSIVDFPGKQGIPATTEKAGVGFLGDVLKKKFGILL